MTLRPADRYLATGAGREERFRRDGHHRATCVYGDVVLDRPATSVRPSRPGRVYTEGKHHGPLAERGRARLVTELPVTSSVRTSTSGSSCLRGVRARLQQDLTRQLARFGAKAFSRHYLDVDDEQQSTAQSGLHCSPEHGLSRGPRAVNSYADNRLALSTDESSDRATSRALGSRASITAPSGVGFDSACAS